MSSHSIPTEIMLKREMDLYQDDDWDTPELEESAYNPANDEFKRTVRLLQKKIQHLTTTLRPRYALVARLSLSPYKYTEIAKKARFTPATVAKIVKEPEVVQLRNALVQLRSLLQGVSALEREQMLWRIAIKNEEFNPRTAIAAVAEMNKMKIDHAAAKEKSKQNTALVNKPNIVVQLSDSRLIPSKLDT